MEKSMSREVEKGKSPTHTGVLACVEGLGYFIQPDDDENAVVGFPGLKPEEVPKGFKVGDRIQFSMDPDRSGNADAYSKIESKR